MKIAIFTPVHAKAMPFIMDTYKALFGQIDPDWTWILLENAGGKIPEEIKKDKRVEVYQSSDDPDQPHNKIGRLKHECCQYAADFDILVELDADDLLVPHAIMEIRRAFKDYPDAKVVFSNSAEFQIMNEPPKEGTFDENSTYSPGEDGRLWRSGYYTEYYGWKHRPISFQGHTLNEMVAWDASPQMMRQIFFAPNHVRAFRREAYMKIGGHDANMGNGDDHDLMCRFFVEYGEKGFRHIDKCLYMYRVHDENSCRVYNAEIQIQTELNYQKYRQGLWTRWSLDHGYRLIELGGRFNAWPGFETIDIEPPASIIADLNGRWPLEDNSVGLLKAYHIFEHLRDPLHTMNESFRVLAPGGLIMVEVPSTDGRGAWQDPTHITFYNSNSFWYWYQEYYQRFIHPAVNVRFQKAHLRNFYPTPYEETHNIVYLQFDGIALKPPYSDRFVGEVQI
jgi:SAM-dependent methyltransferase